MAKYYVIGNMTGNSMDAIDLVLTEFDGDKMRDICSYSSPYSKEIQEKMEFLRAKVKNKTRVEEKKNKASITTQALLVTANYYTEQSGTKPSTLKRLRRGKHLHKTCMCTYTD